MAGIARTPWADPKTLYALFDEAYPQPKDGSRRKAPFVPYLAYTPPDFALTLCFAGGGMLRQWQVRFRCGWQSLERPELDARLAVRRQSATSAAARSNSPPTEPRCRRRSHGFSGMGLDGSRVGHRRDARQSLGRRLQRDDSGDGFRRQSDRKGKRLPDGRQARRT